MRQRGYFAARTLPPASSSACTVSAEVHQFNPHKFKRRRIRALPELLTEVERLSLIIKIGDMPVRVNTTDPGFLAMLQDRYAGFVAPPEHCRD